MNAEERTRIRKALADATPGPWFIIPEKCGPEGQGVYECATLGPICEVGDPYPRGSNCPQENMELIAQAPTWLEKLCDALDVQDAEIAALKIAQGDTATYEPAGARWRFVFSNGPGPWIYTDEHPPEVVQESDALFRESEALFVAVPQENQT